MADDFISNLQSLTSNLEEIVFTRFATVIKKNDDHTVDCREDSGTVHKNIKHSNLFNFQVGDTVILGFVDNDLYEPVIVGTRDVDLGVPTTEEIDELITDLNTLTTDMTNLKNSLIRFNGELISFSADNHNLAENLSKLKENLKFVLDDVKILDAGLGEFYDVLESFGIDIDEFVETLMGLNIDLNILQGYLSDFSGTLEQFDAKLRNELDEETYNKLNEDMVKLIWSISQVRGRTTTVEGQARHLADEIGDDTGYDPSTTQPANLKQWIKWIKWKVGDSNSGMIKDIEALEALIGDDTPGSETGIFADIVTANNHITTINSYIYGNGDAQHPASGSILYQINALVNTDIPKIITDIYGKPDGSSSDYTANSLYGKLIYMENQLWGNGSSGSPSSDSILGRLGAISNNAGTGRLDLLDKQGGTLDTLDSRIKSITNTGGTGSLDVLESTVGDNNSGLVKKANDLTADLSSLESTVGDNNSGLVKKANDLDSKIGSDTSGSETGIYALIKSATDNITSILSTIGSNTPDHETGIYGLIKGAIDSITDINTKIGDDTSGSESGIYLSLKNLSDSISNAESIIGTNDQYTGANTIWGRIRAYLTRLDNISNTSGTGALDVLEDSVGIDVDYTVDGTLKEQADNSRLALNRILNAVFTDYTPVIILDSEDDFDILEDKTFLDISSGNLPYLFLKNNDLMTLLQVTTRFIKIDLTDPRGYKEQTTQVDNCIGVCYDLNDTQVIKNQSSYAMNEPYDVIYELKTNQFYIIDTNTWINTDDLTNFFKYTVLAHQINKWVKNTSLTGEYYLYTNEALRLCILYVNGVNVTNIPSTGAKDVKTFSSTEMPNPPSYNVYSNSTTVSNNIRLTTDRKLQAMAGTGSSMSVATQFMWHY